MRRIGRVLGWVVAYCLGLGALCLAQTWLWWQQDPASAGTGTNALWARHQWVGEPHTDAEYLAFAGLLRTGRITDVFFHAGPLEADGRVPSSKITNVRPLLAALHRYAPGVRAQAYLGQLRSGSPGGLLDIDAPAVRAGVLATDKIMLDLGFDGIHYDVEPVFSDDEGFLTLLGQTRALTRARGRLLSVALEQPTLDDRLQDVYQRVLPRTGPLRYPARPDGAFLRRVAAQVDQIAFMAYDVPLPTRTLVGRDYAGITERALRLVGDQVTVFVGVPTYTPQMGWAETEQVALRGVLRGLDRLHREGFRPGRPYGVALYADWTTDQSEWEHYRAIWVSGQGSKVGL